MNNIEFQGYQPFSFIAIRNKRLREKSPEYPGLFTEKRPHDVCRAEFTASTLVPIIFRGLLFRVHLVETHVSDDTDEKMFENITARVKRIVAEMQSRHTPICGLDEWVGYAHETNKPST